MTVGEFFDRSFEIYDRLERAGVTRWPVLAAALSYYTALSVVPFLAVCFAVAKGFGLEDALLTALSNNFATLADNLAESQGEAGQANLLALLKVFADKFIGLLQDFSGGLLAFGAMAFIFWSGYRILWHLEAIFATIYGYRPPRRAIHRMADYLTILLTVPIFLLAAGTINVYLATLSRSASASLSWFYISPEPLIAVSVSLLPYLLWWVVLSWAYAYFSRGLIRWPERLLGGLIAGCIFQLFQTFYLKIIFALTSYNTIYGSFAAVPFFMIWLYTGWFIVIMGAEITRRLSDRFVSKTKFWAIPPSPTWDSTKALAYEVIVIVIQNYETAPAGKPTSIIELARSTRATLPILGQAVNRLIATGILARVSGPTIEDGPTFLPARSPAQLTKEQVYKILDDCPVELLS